MKSNYGLYMEELEDIDIYEDGRSFMTYKIKDDNELWLYDLFVKKEYRKTGKATELVNLLVNIARECNCKTIVTFTQKTNNGWEISTKALKDYGFVVDGIKDTTIFLKLEVI